MTKTLCRSILFIAAILPFVAAAAYAETPAATKEVPVCLIDFRIDFAVGRESELDNPGICRYSIDEQAFLGLLVRRPDSEYYESRDVRARVAFSHDSIYFIDRSGVVRFGSKKFVIDKQKFLEWIKKR